MLDQPYATTESESTTFSGLYHLFTPQRVVVCSLSKQKVLQQPEEPNQTGTERQRRSLSFSQI